MAAQGQLPTSPKFSSVNLKTIDPTIVTTASSGRRQVKTQNTQFWSMSITYPTMTRSEWSPIAAFIMEQRGARFPFTVVLPEYSTTQGALTTESVTVNGAHSAGDTTIVLQQASLSQTNSLKAGDFIKFANHNKVYMVVADMSFSSGAATVTIEPGIVVDVPSTTAVTYKDVPFTVYLTDDTEWSLGLASTVGYELELREAL